MKQLGPYEIGARLGKGGMGSVYRGANIETGESAAIKALAPQLATADGFRERFEAEIESLKTLKHEGIVRLFGYGEESGTLFYAMELVEGRSLEEELKAGRRFNWREVVDIAIQVCKSLKHAHDHGIVHRDIKPANILLNEDDQVKLADFGIARLFGGTQLTMAGGVLGTADYMSPEQAEGTPVTERCDQYSLGCVMYALLAGRPPFQAKSLPEMLQLQRFAEPDPVRRYAPRAPAQLELAISQLLSKDPEDRFPNTLVLSRHLEAMRRALSRPFENTPAGKSNGAGSNEESVPLEMAETQRAEEALSSEKGPDSEIRSDLELGESIDLDVVPTSRREAATVDSVGTLDNSEDPEPAQERQDHFTEVTGTGGGRSSLALTPSKLASGAALVCLVGALGWMTWNLSQPYNADALYSIICPDTTAPAIDQLRKASDRIEEFLARFPDDPRAQEVEQYAQEIELDRMEKRFATLVRGRGKSSDLLTAERLYLDALQLANADPERASQRFSNLITLFESPSNAELEDPESIAKARRIASCLELARRQKTRLEEKLASQRANDLDALAERLRTAEALHALDPAKAIALCKAIVDLYESEVWADDLVDEARVLLMEWSQNDGE